MSRIMDEPVIWINPKDIKHTTSLTRAECMLFGVKNRTAEFCRERDKAREAGHLCGDWDINPPLFSRDPFFDVLKVHEAGGDLSGTVAWRRSIERYGTNRTRALFLRWLEIWKDMKKNGYRQFPDAPWNEYVLLAVGRGGELHFYQGRHRLAMALMLGITSIPAKVGIRHTEWHNFREEVQRYADAHKGRIYSPIAHPDLSGLKPSVWSGHRGNLIMEHIAPMSKTVLDIGAHWGHFSCLLSSSGRQCAAIEASPEMFHFLQKVCRACGNGVQVHNATIEDFLAFHAGGFDCVLALNIFHHFLKDRAGWERLERVVSSLKCKEMFFQMAEDGKLSKFGGGWKKTADVIQLIKDRAGLNIIEGIGEENGRALYHLKRGTVC